MVAKEWRDARWKLVLAVLAVLAFVVFAPRSYLAIQDDIQLQIRMAEAELASPEAFMGPEESWPPGYTPEKQKAGLENQIEEMRRPDYAVGMAGDEVLGVQLVASFVLVPLAALLGVALISGEMGRRTIFLLLSHPVSRKRILLTKYLIGGAVMFAVALLGGVGIAISGYAHGYPAVSMDIPRILAQSGLFWLGTLSVLGVAALASVLFRHVIQSVIATAAALYAIFYLPNFLRGVASWWSYPEPRDYPEDPMAEQVWQESFEAFRIINYWIIPDAQGQGFTGYQPSIVLCVFVCVIAATLPLSIALWLFRRKAY